MQCSLPIKSAIIRHPRICILIAIHDALQISTVNMGLAVGWAAVVLSFGKKGWRKSLPHSLGGHHMPASCSKVQLLLNCHHSLLQPW
jgi:hypothetical protein